MDGEFKESYSVKGDRLPDRLAPINISNRNPGETHQLVQHTRNRKISISNREFVLNAKQTYKSHTIRFDTPVLNSLPRICMHVRSYKTLRL